MEVSLFLAKFWGLYLIIFFLILTFNPTRISEIFEHLKDRKFSLITSFVAIFIGILNILLHNVWEDNWSVIITIIGWVSLLIGVSIFSFPKKSIALLDYTNVKFVQVTYLLLLIVGLFLLNKGLAIIPY